MGVAGRIATALLVVVTTLAAPAAAYVPEDTPPRRAEAAGWAMLQRPEARGTVPGVVVMRGGRIVWERNAGRPMLPASVMKLATTTAGMRRFGPDHRFPTRVLATTEAPVVEALWLVGGGDATLATEAYRRRRFLPRPTDRIQRPAFASGSPTIEDLASRVAAAGIRSVGALIADESLFDGERTQAGWRSSYLDRSPDVSYLSALTVNEGRTGANRNRLVPSPARAAGDALAAALRARGVGIGGVRGGVAPRQAIEIARVESPPLSEIVDFINRYSVNYPAELLLKSLGAHVAGEGSTAAGARVVRQTLADLGVPVEGLVQRDGSGLSLLNRITPRTVAGILDAILTGGWEGAAELRASIPAAGGPGTLLRRMAGSPAIGNLRGKTGSIRRVRAMAGWVMAADGLPLVYVALFNEARSPSALSRPLDLFGILLTHFPRWP